MAKDWQNAGFGIYFHWPFCQSKCPYCDFNSHVRTAVDQARWARAFVKEIEYHARLTPNRTVDTVFFGGGTPSLMLPETVATILEAVRKNWSVSSSVEVSLEANPTSVEVTRFKGFSESGINRISMGIQALNDPDLKALGRLHSVTDARQAFDIAKLIFNTVSFDLIYARQGQALSSWCHELKTALSMAVDHLSLYQLTIEDGTRFGDLYQRGKLRDLPSDNLASEMFDATQDICSAAGLNAYEVSNHAKSGAECRHNLIYWRYGDYVGIGPGAHGRMTLGGNKLAFESPLSPEEWLAKIESAETATVISETISPNDQFSEYLLMSLRLAEGSNLERLQKLNPQRFDIAHLRQLEDDGFLKLSNQNIKTTPKGRLVLNALLGEILTN
ncbi:MAG: radical SAM family heme chaperone HemW [Rhodobacteraceae bacterium]|nr:radical SAM family heme chaperone HemW [Paracoccaceae bacterium]